MLVNHARWLALWAALGLGACDAERVRSPGTRTVRDGGAADGAVSVSDAAAEDASIPDIGQFDCTGVSPVAGLAERCCPSLGIDACGPGLFCAALDGRTFPACYAEHVRADGESCFADVHCLSFGCAVEQGVCQASSGQSCSRAIGCGPGPNDDTFVCASGTCVFSDRGIGSPCASGPDCNSGYCVDQACTGGGQGDACFTGTDCSSGRCAGGVCTNGALNSPCASAPDCVSGFCVNQRCSDGEEFSICVNGADCQSGVCVAHACSDGGDGRPCARATDCSNGLRCIKPCGAGESCSSVCSSGGPDSACIANSDCQNGLPCVRERSTFPTWSCGGSCYGPEDCTGGLVCSGSAECITAGGGAVGANCAVDGDCSSGICAPLGVGGHECSSVHGYWASCGTCDSAFWCEDRSGANYGHCVGAERTPCAQYHDSVLLWSAECHSVVSRCARYVGAYCEGTSTNCSTDTDCGGARCLVTYGCGF